MNGKCVIYLQSNITNVIKIKYFLVDNLYETLCIRLGKICHRDLKNIGWFYLYAEYKKIKEHSPVYSDYRKYVTRVWEQRWKRLNRQ